MTDDAFRPAAEWLERTYGGLVTVAHDRPVVETERTWLVGCAYADFDEPMLSVSLAVPKNRTEPFPASNTAPLDDVPDAGWEWRVNARGCLVATDAALAHRPSSALPWRPSDETPGWWDRLVAGHFPDAETGSCENWDEVVEAISAGGPETRGAVWLRRQVAGTEITGHLLYACQVGGAVVFVDGQRGALAQVDDAGAGQLVLARFRRSEGPWLPAFQAAPDFTTAVVKATAWLDTVHAGAVALTDPAGTDETARGWLFPCTGKRFLATGDWRDQLLDAAVVVPKAAGQLPFGLPHDNPWSWLAAWDAGEPGLPGTPEPGNASWLGSAGLGEVRATSTHANWAETLDVLADLPDGDRAMVWLRRHDGRNRETVGNLLVAVKQGEDLRLFDGRGADVTFEHDPLALHVIRFEKGTR